MARPSGPRPEGSAARAPHADLSLVLLLLLLLLTTTSLLLLRTSRLETRLARQAEDVLTITGLLEQADENALSVDALRTVRGDLKRSSQGRWSGLPR